MSVPDPRDKPPGGQPSGHERRVLMRWLIPAGIGLFVFLIGYFLLFGPLHKGEPHYPPAGRNLELEREAVPPRQPTAP